MKFSSLLGFTLKTFPLFLCGNLWSATFNVLNTADSGAGSFRQAILDANNSVGADAILFQIPGSAPFVITPLSALPIVTGPVTIDATGQAGFSGQPVVALDGISAGAAVQGLDLSSSNCTVRGLAIGRFSANGIYLTGGGHAIQGNFLGIGISGIASFGNTESGIMIYQASNNLIGGTSAGTRNVISANQGSGISLIDPPSTGNQILGNYIGTDPGGTLKRANVQDGITFFQAGQNIVGGFNTASRNVISGNAMDGIYLYGASSEGNQILGNFIGTDWQGSSILGNGENGVTLFLAASNQIGSAVSGGGNLISGNTQRGIYFGSANGNAIQGNVVGLNAAGTAKLANVLGGVGISACSNNLVGGTTPGTRNVISGNNQSGILIDGPTSAANLVQGNFIGTDLNGAASLGNSWNGVTISTAPGNTVGGEVPGAGNLISGNLQRGILITGAGATGNKIQGNLIGTDATGKLDRGNAYAGVWIESGGNLIGGTNAGARNIISGNDQSGVMLIGTLATTNSVQGNFIGTDISGSNALNNSFFGVAVTNAPSNVIGGSVVGAGNLISGNSGEGISFRGNNSRFNHVEGNFIGTDITGMSALANNGGIFFYGSPSNTVGGTLYGAGNLISGNNNVGISIGDPGANGNAVQGNFIGTKADRLSSLGNLYHGVEMLNTSSNNVIGGIEANAGNVIAHAGVLRAGVRVRDGCSRNSIRGNSIFSNSALGIDLGVAGVAPNDVGDGDSGANDLQNFPIINSVTGRYLTVIRGTLNSLANKNYDLDFYASPAPDPTGYGEGQTWLGAINVATDGTGNASFTARFTNAVPVDRFITSTATDPLNNTSEFSSATSVVSAPFVDSDGDGIPDEFEIAANLNSNDPSDAALDNDGDGMSNLNEYLAGTDPLDPASSLRLFPLVKSSSGALLRFPSVTDKRYALEFTTNFLGWNVLTNFIGDKSILQANDSGAIIAPSRFYRVHLLP
ncbi:MAG: hypothetical protein ABI042_12830 [Verrucomicrobiota bacterium]